jgi:hypothetical protein
MRAGGNPPTPRRGARPGFLVIYRGAELGVVERVATAESDGTVQLYVRGGIAGGLTYVIPAGAIRAIDAISRRAEVDGSVTFVPQPTRKDGAIWLSACLDASASASSARDVSPSVGARVRAVDGPLGSVESVSLTPQGLIRSVVVRGRRGLRTRRYEVPVALLRPSGRAPGEFRAEGIRRELRAP